MQEHGPDLTSVMWKIIINVGGLLIGLSAKMAILYEQNRLNFKRFLMHSSLAISSAWIVYFILDSKGLANAWMPIAGPLIGRFGDQVIIAIWQMVKDKMLASAKKEGDPVEDVTNNL